MSKSLFRPLPSYRREGSTKRLFVGIVVVAIGIFVSTAIVECTLLKSVSVRSVSMEPTIQGGDFIMVSPVVFGKTTPFSNTSFFDFGQPRRGEIVLVSPPYTLSIPFYQKLIDTVLSFVSLGRVGHRSFNSDERSWESSPVLRRVIALPGDEVFMTDGVFFVRPKGKQDFVEEQRASGANYSPAFPQKRVHDKNIVFSDEMAIVTVPKNRCFVATDNRATGMDSRHWGPIDIDSLRGQAFLRYWPPTRFGLIQ